MGTWLPCPDAQTSVPPFYVEIAGLKRPPCNQFVISISSGDYMPLTGGSPRRYRALNTRLAVSWHKKEEAPAGGESGRRAHGPTLGGEAGPVLLEAYSAKGQLIDPCSLSQWN